MNTNEKAFGHQTRLLLWCGFGGLLLLMVVVGVSALSFMYQIQVRQEKIRADYVERDLTLEKIRSDIYISGTYVRDYLLDSSEENAATHKAAFLEARGRIESGVRDYERLVRPAERAVFDQFRKETRDYLDTVSPAVAWTAAERRARGAAFVQDQVLPRRSLAVDLTDRVHALTERQLEASSLEVGDLFSNFRTRLVLLLAFTLGIGLALAGSSLRRILALEREGESRFQEILRTQAELKRLSSELLSAQENERRRISRELHDEVGQVLSAIMLGLGNLRAAIEMNDREEALSQLQLVQDMTQRNASVVRNISLLLRPTMLDDLGLLPALKWLAREVSRTSGIHVEVVAEDGCRGIARGPSDVRVPRGAGSGPQRRPAFRRAPDQNSCPTDRSRPPPRIDTGRRKRICAVTERRPGAPRNGRAHSSSRRHDASRFPAGQRDDRFVCASAAGPSEPACQIRADGLKNRATFIHMDGPGARHRLKPVLLSLVFRCETRRFSAAAFRRLDWLKASPQQVARPT